MTINAMPQPTSHYNQIMQLLLLFMAILLPLKFGALTGVPETTSMFPANFWEAAIINWPAMSFPFFSGIILLLVLFARGKTAGETPALHYNTLWLLLFAITFLGIINASTADFVYIQLVHIAGLTALATATTIMLNRSLTFRNQLLFTIATGAVIISALGVQQYFFGFNDTLEMLKQQQQNGGISSSVIEAFLNDRRIFSTFTLPNTLAGYMLLTMPLCLVGAWNICGQIEPPKISRMIFIPLLVLLFGVVFILTRSRAAFISLGAAVALFLLLLPLANRYRLALLGSIILTVIAGFFYIHYSHRGFSSIVARLDYNIVAWKIMLLHPLAGTGWGDFFHDYMLLKALPTDEAPHTPHSFLMAYACQTGIAGLLVAAAVMVYPLFRGFRQIKSLEWQQLLTIDNAILFGLTAWSIHSLQDVNLESPGSTGTAIILSLCILCHQESTESKLTAICQRKSIKILRIAVMAGLAIFAALGSAVMIRGEYNYSEMVRLQSESLSKESQRPTPDQVRIQFMATIDEMPWSPFPWASAGRYLLTLGDTAGAENCYLEAIKRSPERSAFYYELSMIQTQAGKTEAAAKSVDQALRLFPNNPKYKNLPNHQR